MDKKKLMLLVGALIIAIGTAFMARSVFTGAAAPQADAAAINQNGPKVLVSQRAQEDLEPVIADAHSDKLHQQATNCDVPAVEDTPGEQA